MKKLLIEFVLNFFYLLFRFVNMDKMLNFFWKFIFWVIFLFFVIFLLYLVLIFVENYVR